MQLVYLLFLEYKSWKIRMQVMNPNLKEEKKPWNNMGLICCLGPI